MTPMGQRCETCNKLWKSTCPYYSWIEAGNIGISCDSYIEFTSIVGCASYDAKKEDTFLCCNSIHEDISNRARMRERALLLERLDKKIYELQASRKDGLIPTSWLIHAIDELYKEGE